jgi:integral membrane protein
MDQNLRTFCLIALIEGISYLLLLGVAMPMKYFLDMPMAVTVTGWAHGVLFMAYGASLLVCWIKYRWSFTRVVGYFIASLLPILPFLIEKRLRKEYQLS